MSSIQRYSPHHHITPRSPTEKKTSSEKAEQENKSFWTPTKVIAACFLGSVAIGVTAGIINGIYKNHLTTVDPNEANCIEHWGKGISGTCCTEEQIGSSPKCQQTKQQFREGILAKNPQARFTYLIKDMSIKLSKIATDIESGLKKLSQMVDTDSSKIDLKKDLAQKLFVDLPSYCDSQTLPESLEALRPKLFAKELDYMHERNPELLSTRVLNGLWRHISLQLHPDKGGEEKLFAKAASIHDFISTCIKHLSNGNPSCRWMELKPIEHYTQQAYTEDPHLIT